MRTLAPGASDRQPIARRQEGARLARSGTGPADAAAIGSPTWSTTDGVEIHRLHLDAPALDPTTEALSEQERLRARSFHQAIDRTRFVVGRTTLRQLPGARLGLAPRQVPLLEGPHGKPMLPGGGDLHFNVSHAGDHVLVAISEGRAIGIDVEVWAPLGLEAVASLVFSPAEQWELAQRREPRRTRDFFRCWTRKEAVLKGEGTGFSVEASRLHVGLDDAFPRRVRGIGGRSWWVEDLHMPDGCAAAIAVEGGSLPWRIHDREAGRGA